MSGKSKIPLTARIIARFLRPKYGMVRAMDRALRLQSVVRFAILTSSLIIFPSVVLGYIGIVSIQEQERTARSELQSISTVTARSFLDHVVQEFSSFETLIRNTLEAGRIPHGSLHPHQRVFLRFDRQRQLISPFVESKSPTDVELLFHPVLRDKKNSSNLAKMQGNILFQKALGLLQKGKKKSAITTFIGIQKQFPRSKTIGGATLSQLVTLKKAPLLPPAESSTILFALVEEIVNAQWTLDDGMQGAIGLHALAQLQQVELEASNNSVRIDEFQSRLDDKIEELYWTLQWRDEWQEVLKESRQTGSGDLYWRVSEKGLWAKTNWNGDIFIFGLDKNDVVRNFRQKIREKLKNEGRLEMALLSPKDPANNSMIFNIPWLSGWKLAVFAKDSEQSVADSRRDLWQKSSLIALAVFCIAFGIFVMVRVAGKEIEVANIKSSFAASVSHELRSPITQIRLKGESLLFGLAETEDELQEHYESIVRESERLSWLVDNVLDYAAIERDSKQYILRPLDMGETVQRVVDSLEATLSMRDVQISMNIARNLPLIRHDPDAVSQCVINLLSNAAKYSRDEKSINILVRQVVAGIDVVISDRGIGIEAEDIKRVFEPFFRSNEEDARRRKGTGIGLAITKHIMDAHGGTILIQSRRNVGSSFTLRFPVQLLESEGANQSGK